MQAALRRATACSRDAAGAQRASDRVDDDTGRVDDGGVAGQLGGDRVVREGVVGAADQQRVERGRAQPVQVDAEQAQRIAPRRRSGFDQRGQPRARHHAHFELGAPSPDRALERSAAHGGRGRDDADAPAGATRRGGGSAAQDVEHRHAQRGGELARAMRAHCVARDDQRLQRHRARRVEQAPRRVADGGFVLVAVGHVRRIGDVGVGLLGKALAQREQRGQAAHAGIDHADRGMR
ncbi:hypothetical protein GALL_370440 [mine drainage metagenome]|uniref:Uncharacterized protein n=1 Tax=mine drainage metagenome TaxID=410659 RepID=A0A1J5QZ65_9ZZZZ